MATARILAAAVLLSSLALIGCGPAERLTQPFPVVTVPVGRCADGPCQPAFTFDHVLRYDRSIQTYVQFIWRQPGGIPVGATFLEQDVVIRIADDPDGPSAAFVVKNEAKCHDIEFHRDPYPDWYGCVVRAVLTCGRADLPAGINTFQR